ncbi:piggyBac transposable element-derived protein 4-like [Dreissena polymorpha]|uniref:piggyBac transposable element-derived protein 4-like n=1 Tax=Dreissena polymorpha TaxID=45954 RepID=UPI0022650F01|nr:piggyBac transposable element-derived protein 4-like [Dreissena polymorpha]
MTNSNDVDSDDSLSEREDTDSSINWSDFELQPESESTDNEDNSEKNEVDREWSSTFSPLQINEFTQKPGPNLPATFDVNLAQPLDYFYLLFHPTMFSDMARHTNSYAAWQMQIKEQGDKRWEETSESDIKTFIGLLMMIGASPEPRVFWSEEPMFGSPGIKRTMSLSRFKQLIKYFQASDRNAQPLHGSDQYDWLYKIRPVLDHVSETFQNCFNYVR